MAPDLEVVRLQSGPDDERIDGFLDECPHAFAQQTSPWRDVVAPLGPDAPHFLGCLEDGRLVGLLPAYLFQGRFGGLLTSAPQAGALGGVVCLPDCDEDATYRTLLEAFVDLGRELDCVATTVCSNPFWPDTPLYEEHLAPDLALENTCQVLDLTAAVDSDGHFPAASGHVTRQLRKAEKAGLRIDQDQTPANLEEWYPIHSARHRALGATPLPRALFEGALETMVPRGRASFFFVRLPSSGNQPGEMVAGCLYLHHGQVIDALMPSVAAEHAQLAPNYLLAAHSIRWAKQQGLRYYNWQGSPPDGGVRRFKLQWGSHEASYRWMTRLTGDAGALDRCDPVQLREAYPWHFVVPFDRIGSLTEKRAASMRGTAWQAGQGEGR